MVDAPSYLSVVAPGSALLLGPTPSKTLSRQHQCCTRPGRSMKPRDGGIWKQGRADIHDDVVGSAHVSVPAETPTVLEPGTYYYRLSNRERSELISFFLRG